MAWEFLRRRDRSEIAPDFLDLRDREMRRQLEKSAKRTLPFDAARRAAGEPVRDFFLRSVDLQTRYPLGLLPIGQKRMAKWLLKEGKRQHSFTDEQILAFLFETAADLPRAIADTYLISPE